MLKNNKDILTWIHDNLGEAIRLLTDDKYKDTIYTEALIAGMICRETGPLILRYANQGKDFETICSLMKGDYGQRPADSRKIYHGFGFVQIDIYSYPKFIQDTPLSDYNAYLEKAILVLEEKRKYIEGRGFTKEVLGDYEFLRAVVAAYNTGQGNVVKSLRIGRDVDTTTHQGNYSREVFKFRFLYHDLFNKNS